MNWTLFRLNDLARLVAHENIIPIEQWNSVVVYLFYDVLNELVKETQRPVIELSLQIVK